MSTTEWLTKAACVVCKNAGVFIHSKEDPICQTCHKRRAVMMDDDLPADDDAQMVVAEAMPDKKAEKKANKKDEVTPAVSRALAASLRDALARWHTFCNVRSGSAAPLPVMPRWSELAHIYSHIDLPHNEEHTYDMMSGEATVLPFSYARPGELPWRPCDMQHFFNGTDMNARNFADRVHAPYERQIIENARPTQFCPQCARVFHLCSCLA